MWLDFCRVSNPQWHHVLFTLVLYYLIGRGVWLEIKLIRLKYARPVDAPARGRSGAPPAIR